MIDSIVYVDENDRCYGLSGMAVALSLYNNEEKIVEIDIDRHPDPIDFTPDFYFSGNPRYSAKVVWSDMAHNFHLALAMALGNLFSRRMIISDRTLNDSEEKYLQTIARQEGYEACGLEPDEIEAIWNKDYVYIRRVFAHPAVKKITSELAEELKSKRVLSRQELVEFLMKING